MNSPSAATRLDPFENDRQLAAALAAQFDAEWARDEAQLEALRRAYPEQAGLDADADGVDAWPGGVGGARPAAAAAPGALPPSPRRPATPPALPPGSPPATAAATAPPLPLPLPLPALTAPLRLASAHPVTAVALSAAGPLCGDAQGRVAQFDLGASQPRRVWAAHGHLLRGGGRPIAALLVDGPTLYTCAAAGGGPQRFAPKVWQWADGSRGPRLAPLPVPVRSLAKLTHGPLLGVAGDGLEYAWTPPPGGPLAAAAAPAVAAGETRFAAADGGLLLRRLATGVQVCQADDAGYTAFVCEQPWAQAATAVALHAPHVAVGLADGSLQVGAVLQAPQWHIDAAHGGPVRRLALRLPWLASAGDDGALRLWHMGHPGCVGALLPAGHGVAGLALDAAQVLAVGDDGVAYVWRLPAA